MRRRLAIVLLVVLAQAAFGQDSQTPEDAALRIRTSWREVAAVARMPFTEQTLKIKSLYVGACTRLHGPQFAEFVVWSRLNSQQLLEQAVTVSDPAQEAAWERSMSIHDYGYLEDYSRHVCSALFEVHPSEFIPLVKGDLRSDDELLITRGIWYTNTVFGSRPQSIPVSIFHSELVEAFKKSDRLTASMAFLFSMYRNPELIKILLKRDPEDPTKFYEPLAVQLESRPAPHELLDALESHDSEVRYRALYALS